MPTPIIDSELNSFSFTEEEFHQAASYSEAQLSYIQTQLAEYAQQKLNLSADAFTTPEDFIRAHEYHRGLMDSMKYLLEVHKQVIGLRRKKAEEEALGLRFDLFESSSSIGHGD